MAYEEQADHSQHGAAWASTEMVMPEMMIGSVCHSACCQGAYICSRTPKLWNLMVFHCVPLLSLACRCSPSKFSLPMSVLYNLRSLLILVVASGLARAQNASMTSYASDDLTAPVICSIGCGSATSVTTFSYSFDSSADRAAHRSSYTGVGIWGNHSIPTPVSRSLSVISGKP